jgi:mgtE-like transporter
MSEPMVPETKARSDEETPDRARRLPIFLRWMGLLARAMARPPVRAARGAGRLVADPARQVADYWRTERSTIRQGFVANLISALTSLISGLVLAAMKHRLQTIEGLFILIPVSVGMRGNIFGALSARLGTAIHSGLFEVSRRRDSVLVQNISSTTVLTVGTSVAAALLAKGVAAAVGQTTVPVWDFIVISLVGGLLSSAFVLAFTVYLSAQSFRRGWDLDSVGAVLVTVIGDVVTLPCILLATFLSGIHIVTVTLGVIFLVVGVAATVYGVATRSLLARRIIRESFPILVIAALLDVLAGVVVEPRVDHLFRIFPAFLVFLPGFLENTGALGSILAARLGSKLHLGAVEASLRPSAVALLDGTIVALLGVFIYTLSAVTSLLVAGAMGQAAPSALLYLGACLLAAALALVFAAAIGYYAAIVTFRFGFDPDNHTIPLVSSGMDLIGVICLVVALVAVGVA